MSAPVGPSLLKGRKRNGDLGQSLGSCCLVAVGETSEKSSCRTGEISGIVDDTQIKFTAQVDPSLAVPPKGKNILPSSGWRGIESIFCQISRESGNHTGGIEEEDRNKHGSGKQRSSRYKGVLAQPNGRWGAQIYEKHKRVWLGTFNAEEDAAQSYDTAALKFRGRKAITNFNPIHDTHPEAIFLGHHSKAEIVDMLRTHTYREELRDYYQMNGASNPKIGGVKPVQADGFACQRKHLFEKVLTPSDVGKLNRLVIPKIHAQRWLPLEVASREKGVILNCEDDMGKTWRFKYSYWNSSQSYVLTKGWCRYTKGKCLKAGDIVAFERSTSGLRQLYIRFRLRSFGNLPVQPTFVNHLPVHTESGAEFDLGARIQDGSVKGLIPWLAPICSSSAFDFYGLHSSEKLVSEKRNSRALDSFTSPDSSSVTVFGVNLSL